ncbi:MULTISPECIES: mycofactocin biosynthesis chaperone MftB [Nocardia]|uniref:Mycofactocin binding protein MftB n=2 Tax=Nocardia farcinica TaxID=37329 RepID=Q5YXL0_NOCFA|nr:MULTISPECIES: mycofactocin biosynthesis chaperone MftB [Nocardia]SLH04059.1 mycofactocin system RPExFGAL protein [Mycobacteroides abscessus subsp. abscessus]AXK85209.1 mycofactocin biosynthesis chaperone MftB [Nocardia farcinica]MBA4858259.1 mycofactocin biosynthesis chaperone MftB [Nocardia farcinica]MBC9818028.1 mycofactocin biosynthesis chaperone MftB [Nocardia farcinica]MBF6140222.1 mycofactocin biosynthesis chaperone MftB [Nocardia farcinica]
MSTEARRFDPAQPYRLAPSVAVRPEPFGALLYDYTTRRLSFLKTPTLVRVVQSLATQPAASAALTAAAIPVPERPRYLAALAELAAAGTIQLRSPA